MKFLLLLPFLVGLSSYAQTPEKGFLEISPEQEEKLRQIEIRKKDALIKKAEAEKRKKEEARIAAEKKAEEKKKLEAEQEKKAEAEALTKWLISEKERKMKEAESEAQAQAKAQADAEAQAKAKADAQPQPQARGQSIGTQEGSQIAGLHKMAGNSRSSSDDKDSIKNFKVPEGVRVIAIGGLTGTPRKKEIRFFGKEFPRHSLINVVSRKPYILLFMVQDRQSWHIKDGTKLVAVFNEAGDVQKTTMNADAPIFHNNLNWGDKWGIASSFQKDDSHYHDEKKMKSVMEEYSRRLFKQELSHFEYHKTIPEKIEITFKD